MSVLMHFFPSTCCLLGIKHLHISSHIQLPFPLLLIKVKTISSSIYFIYFSVFLPTALKWHARWEQRFISHGIMMFINRVMLWAGDLHPWCLTFPTQVWITGFNLQKCIRPCHQKAGALALPNWLCVSEYTTF